MDNSSFLTLDERIDGLVKDDPDILRNLSRITSENEFMEIVSELPAGKDPDIILGYVSRWQEITKLFHKKLRVYAWSYSDEVEKYVLGFVQNMSDIYVTVLPTYLKENKLYG